MPTDPLPTFAYCLIADNTRFGFMKSASFPTANSLVFELPLDSSKPFLDSMTRKGLMPFQRWSLIVLDIALRAVLRYDWGQTRVTRIRFPSLENQSTKPLRCTIECTVTGVQQGSTNAQSATSDYGSGAYTPDPLPNFLIQWIFDGVLGLDFNISKVGAFDIRYGAPADLVLTATPEKMADPFRNWLNSGNSSRAGTLNCLNTALQLSRTLRFTGLRVRTITPALTTNSPGPGTIHLAYSSVSF